MNDIDFDELDRAIALAMQKDVAAATPAAAADDKDEVVPVADEPQPAVQPQPVVPLEPQPLMPSPKDVPQSAAIVLPATEKVSDKPVQASTKLADTPAKDIDMTPQEVAIVHEVLQEIRETHRTQLQEAATLAASSQSAKYNTGLTTTSHTEEVSAVQAQDSMPTTAATASSAAVNMPAEATTVDEHSPVPPLVLPKRSEMARRTPSAAVHARTMPGRSISRMAEITPSSTQASAVAATSVVNTVVPSATPAPVPPTPVVEISSHDRHMAEVMTAELKRAADVPTVLATTSKVTQEDEQTIAKRPTPTKKTAPPARAAHLNPTARDTIRRAGRFMDMVHPSSDMRHMMAGAASAAPVMATDVILDSGGGATAPDRTKQTSDDKVVEGKVTDLLTGAKPEHSEVLADDAPHLGEEAVDSISDIETTAEVAIDEIDGHGNMDTLADSTVEAAAEEVSQDTSAINPIVLHEEYHTPAAIVSEATPPSLQPTIEAQSAIADTSKLDTETHPIFDTDSYMQPVATEVSHHSNMVWKILGVVLVVLLVVAAILLWQLSSI